MTLLGRLAELAACQQVLSAGREGAAAAVITGAPGIGKTTLWRAAADKQPAGTVLRTTGLQVGQAGLANLADLLNPVADAAPRLPPPQAAALRAALGLAAVDAPVTAALLELATVGLLRELAVAGVVVAVDDEQWMDPDSLRLLETAVVRLKDVPVRWLVAVRSGHTGRGLAQVLDHELGPAVTRVDLAGLDDEALSELVMDRFPGRWSPGVLRRVVALAAGSPYAALELARETAAQGGREGTAVRLPATLADSLRSRLERLSPGVLAVVQAAAVAETPTRALLRAVCGQTAAGRVDEALEAGVLDTAPPDPVLRFSHPLLREAAETMLTGPGRRRLHRAIGTALADPDQAAWHLAHGADEPDETLAARAGQAARHASERGAPARAAALAQVAADLTPDPDSLPAWRRRISWLERLVTAGEYEQARQLSEKWAPHVPPTLRGRLTVVRAGVEIDIEAACGLYAEAFAHLAGRDPARAADAGSNMCYCLVMHQRLGEARSRIRSVIEQAHAAGNPVVLRQTLAEAGFLAALAGEPGAGDQLRKAMRLPGFTDTPFSYGDPETILGLWHMWRGELDPARDLLKAALDVAERQGSPESAEAIKSHLAEVEWRAGNWDTAAAHAAAVARWWRESSAGQQGIPAYVVSLIAAGRGNLERARELAAAGVAQAEAQTDWAFAAACRSVLGLAELSADDPAAALRWLEPIADMLQDGGIGEPGVINFTPDLVEAWAATGQPDRAADRLAWLQDAAARLDHPWARITAGRAEAALRLAERDPAAAIRAAAAVIPEARERGLPFELGRCLLALGTAQRKARQRRDAAATLDEAAAVFDGLGARRWQALAQAQRARLAPGPDNALTPTERRIADLVAAGQSNPEIAATLYVSVKTVESNLTRIYRKLGLRSRVELARSRPS
jgi:DNA-binding CsgD family transcriptional regulator/tetratricopeptide (TPR) repeat protein